MYLDPINKAYKATHLLSIAIKTNNTILSPYS